MIGTGTSVDPSTGKPATTSTTVYFTGVGVATAPVGGQPIVTQLTLGVNPNSAYSNQQESLTATLSPFASQNNSTNSEPVSFYDGTSLLGAGALENGTSTISVTLSAGSHILSASYAGDGTFSASTSSSLPYMVTAAQPNISLNVGAGSMTIDGPGHSGTQTVQVTSVQGFSGQVNLSCKVAYAGTGSANNLPTCAFNPNPVQTSPQTASSTVLTVSTTAPSTAAAVRNPWLGAATALAALLFAGTWRRMRWQIRILQSLVMSVLVVALIGCSNGGSISNGSAPGSTTPGTTTGKYAVTVSATSGSITQSITINLVVN